jgi:hypothetical protein
VLASDPGTHVFRLVAKGHRDALLRAAPVVVSRPAGDYRIVVKKEGFETFDAKLGVSAGQDVDLPAKARRAG